jgi:glycosyltransferase involved in cell wall biosynthesis
MSLQGKRVLVMSSVYPLTPDGNHGAFIREMILRLQPTGAQFSVFAPAYEGSRSYSLEGVHVHRFRYFFKRFENLVRDGAPTKLQRQPLYIIPAICYVVLGSLQLFWLCLRQRPDLLHVNWPFPHGVMAWPVRRLLRIPTVYSFYGGELMMAQRYGFVAGLMRWLLPQADGVSCISSFTQGLIQQLADVPLWLIPYGLTVTAKQAKPRQPDRSPSLLFVGRLDERKGVGYLLDAMALLNQHRSVRLRIVGKGILEDELKAQCRQLGLDQQVDFLGFVTKEALVDEYASCDVFVLPAIVDRKGDTEGLGIVMMEALAHNRPVVATTVGGIPDVIKSGETGYLVPERNPQALAEAVEHLLNHPEEADRLAQAGLTDIQTRFSWARIIPLWEALFAQALMPQSGSDALRLEQLTAKQ